MKNKQKLMVSLAVLLTLALLTLVGCVRVNTNYDLSNIGTVKISDAIDSVLPSCVVVDVKKYFTSENAYSCVGVVVEDDKIIVPAQAISTKSGYTYSARLYGSNQTIELENDFVLNKEIGVCVLTVKTRNVKLSPVKFGDSDSLAIGETLFGIGYDAPIISAQEPISTETADYMLAIKAIVSSKIMSGAESGAESKFVLPEDMCKATYTIQGNFNPSAPVAYTHYFSNIKLTRNLSLTDYILFNEAGEFVGLSYLRFVDETFNNNDVTLGIGYACKSNSIKELLLTN